MEVERRIERRRNKNWEVKKLEEIALIVDGTHQTPNYTDSGVRFVSVENIGCIRDTDKFISLEDYEKFKVKPQRNDILMTRITAGVIGKTEIVQSNEPLGYYVSLALIRCNEEQDVEYVNEAIGTIDFRKELNKRIIHTAFPKKINLRDIGKCQIILPSKEIQKKIVVLAQYENELIRLLSELILNKKRQRCWLVNMLLNKTRNEMWRYIRLGEVINQIDIRTTENNEYPVLTSSRNGIFFQTEYFNKNMSSEDNTGYKIVSYGQFTYRTMSDDGKYTFNIQTRCNKGIVSPAYFVFEVNEKMVDAQFLYYLMNDYSFDKHVKVLQQGGTRKALKFADLCSIKVCLPSIEVQKEIVKLIQKADEEIALFEKKKFWVEQEKKCIIDNLLFGRNE